MLVVLLEYRTTLGVNLALLKTFDCATYNVFPATSQLRRLSIRVCLPISQTGVMSQWFIPLFTIDRLFIIFTVRYRGNFNRDLQLIIHTDYLGMVSVFRH